MRFFLPVIITLLIGSSFSISCIEQQNTGPVQYLSKLPYQLRENSGLFKVDSTYWTFNDGGNGEFLYQIDPEKGDILNTIKLAGVDNIDWEAVCTLDDQIYLGDIGNNDHKRKDLAVHRIEKDELFKSKHRISQSFPFSYKSQKKFPPKKDRDYDVEAMIAQDRDIFLFSKNVKKTKVYKVSQDSTQSQKAIKIGSMEIDGRVTAAAINPSSNYILLVTLSDSHRLKIWLFENCSSVEEMLEINPVEITTGITAQVEAIAHKSDNQFYLLAEKGSSIHARSFLLDLDEYINN